MIELVRYRWTLQLLGIVWMSCLKDVVEDTQLGGPIDSASFLCFLGQTHSISFQWEVLLKKALYLVVCLLLPTQKFPLMSSGKRLILKPHCNAPFSPPIRS